MVLRTENFNIFGVYWKIQLLGKILKNQYKGEDCLMEGAWTVCWFKDGGLGKKEGAVFLRGGGGFDTPMLTMIILYYLESSRIVLTKLNSSILIEIMTIPAGQVDEFYFYMHYSIKSWFFEKIIFELIYLFHIVLKSLVFY